MEKEIMVNEKRLIDAYAFYKKFANDTPTITVGEQRYVATWRISDMIADAPTVDAVEVVHGRWKYYHKQNIAVCTNCSFERDLDANFGRAISCPNCGADMRERETEDDN
jgi:predicted RNA-binding Zn-ribbon protein involved in translation (DUF1610 family)